MPPRPACVGDEEVAHSETEVDSGRGQGRRCPLPRATAASAAWLRPRECQTIASCLVIVVLLVRCALHLRDLRSSREGRS